MLNNHNHFSVQGRRATAVLRMKRGRPVLVWRVDIPFLKEEHWKYEGSKAGEGHGGRTHTFGVKNPASVISGAIAYQTPGIVLSRGGPTLVNGSAW
jgi:hypothetical protein